MSSSTAKSLLPNPPTFFFLLCFILFYFVFQFFFLRFSFSLLSSQTLRESCASGHQCALHLHPEPYFRRKTFVVQPSETYSHPVCAPRHVPQHIAAQIRRKRRATYIHNCPRVKPCDHMAAVPYSIYALSRQCSHVPLSAFDDMAGLVRSMHMHPFETRPRLVVDHWGRGPLLVCIVSNLESQRAFEC
jgi:hypothetical protein